jgi:hypothetical protein
MAEGPASSRHRFRWSRPTSLCLWFGRDPPNLRWALEDGLIGLVDLARLHLIKEARWRATGHWPGLEYHPRPGSSETHRGSATKISESGRNRLAHQRCWCGRARYSSCHEALPSDDELAKLRIVARPHPATEAL